MHTTDAALTLMAKMALADGKVDDKERGLLSELLELARSGQSIDELLSLAADHSIADLAASVTAYEDGFFVAFRAYMMATVDGHFDAAEMRLYRSLLQLFKISKDDQELIETTNVALTATIPVEPPARVMELYERSSFAAEGS